MKPLHVALLVALALFVGGVLFLFREDSQPRSNSNEARSLPHDSATLGHAVGGAIRSELLNNTAIAGPGAASGQKEFLPEPVERLFDCSFEDWQASNERRDTGSPTYYTGDNEQLTATTRKMVRDLEDAADPELLAVAAYLRMRVNAAGDRGSDDRRRTIESDNPLVAWTWLAICEHSQLERCVDGSALQYAIAVDRGNGAVLERLASQAFRDGENERAFAILEQALAAPRFNTYFPAQVALFDRALAATGHADYQTRIEAAFGFAVAMGRATDTFRACTRDTLSSAYWHTCDQYGQRLESGSSNLLDQMIGLSMQENVHRLQGGQRDMQNVMARKEEIRSVMEIFAQSDMRLVMNSDVEVLRQYMEHFMTYGELTAIQFLGKEVRRLAADPSYDPCADISRPNDEDLQNPDGL